MGVKCLKLQYYISSIFESRFLKAYLTKHFSLMLLNFLVLIYGFFLYVVLTEDVEHCTRPACTAHTLYRVSPFNQSRM